MRVTARGGVAAGLLRDGEIGSGEFLRMVWPDVVLHPGETMQEHSPELDADAAAAPLAYVQAIAYASLDNQSAGSISRRLAGLASLAPEQKESAAAEIRESLLASDRWARKMNDRIAAARRETALPGRDQLAISEQISRRAGEMAAPVPARDRLAMERNLRFWRLRVEAGATLAASVAAVATRDVPMAALIAGAGHTPEISAALSKANRPFLVFTPLSLKNHDRRGEITLAMLDRKYRGVPFHSHAVARLLEQSLANTERKAQPMLSEPVYQASVELRWLTERVCNKVRSAGSVGEIRLENADLRGGHVRIDPGSVKVVAGPLGEKTVEFRAEIGRGEKGELNAQRKASVWVKAATSRAAATEAAGIEALLKDALLEIRKPAGPTGRTEEGMTLRVGPNTVAAFATTESGIRAIPLSVAGGS
ncbi:MAG: hypothetical protein NTY38_33605 [Acidobacteria bacterium]|nr:hypothetical protein [Acidobacteriota bacterium]